MQEHNFWDALKGAIKNITVDTALHTKFGARGKLPTLPQPWQENLLHIGQEALTNTLKYAHARNFETRLTYKAKELRLELHDGGDGFKLKDRHDGVGLTGMRDRAEQMGGMLGIKSRRGKGTDIVVVLPYDERLVKAIVKSHVKSAFANSMLSQHDRSRLAYPAARSRILSELAPVMKQLRDDIRF